VLETAVAVPPRSIVARRRRKACRSWLVWIVLPIQMAGRQREARSASRLLDAPRPERQKRLNRFRASHVGRQDRGRVHDLITWRHAGSVNVTPVRVEVVVHPTPTLSGFRSACGNRRIPAVGNSRVPPRCQSWGRQCGDGETGQERDVWSSSSSFSPLIRFDQREPARLTPISTPAE
jgi:hypothetical protein